MAKQNVSSEKKEAFYAHILGFFDQQVLASYRNQPDKYVLETDYFEGHLHTADDGEERDEEEAKERTIDIRFGYRTRDNGDLALVVYLPDLFERSAGHVPQWAGYHLQAPKWTTETDTRFDLWKARYLEGSWDVDNGPRSHLEAVIASINALCLEVVGQPLFKYPTNPALNFPAAQNSYAYQDAHRELYSYVIDGLTKQTISLIAAKQGLVLNLNSEKTVDALKKALPTLPTDSILWSACATISTARREAGHGVRSPAQRLLAFEQFTRDMEALVSGLQEVLKGLEHVLGMDGEKALKRQQAKAWLPRIDRPARGHYSINQVTQTVGRTIEHVEYGFRQHRDDLHESEAIILYFTDGSILGIDTGSNVGNIVMTHEEFHPDDFHADFMLTWVPS